MDCHVYYKSAIEKKLRQVFVQGVMTHGDAIEEVAEMLLDEKDNYQKPLLALILGGKV